MRLFRLATTVAATILLSGAFTARAQQPLPMKHTGKPTVPAITFTSTPCAGDAAGICSGANSW